MRVHITRSKNAECFDIIKSIYENGLHTSKVVEKLGNLEQVRQRAGKEDPGRNPVSGSLKALKSAPKTG